MLNSVHKCDAMSSLKELWCLFVHGVFHNKHGYVKMRYQESGERVLVMRCRQCGRAWKTKALEETRP